MNRMNGADSLVVTLKLAGVDVCFTNPGTSEMHFVAALDRSERIRCVLALQENVATGAADGYGRMAGKPAATLLHLGPGLANGLANIHNAKKARAPMLNIVGDHATYHVKFNAPLTSDIEGIARPVSDWVKTTQKSDDVGIDAAVATREAASWPGRIATLILPADASWSPTDLIGDPLIPEGPAKPDPAKVEAAAKALKSAKKAAIFVTGMPLQDDNPLLLGKIKAATGCDVIAPTANRRIDRGAGRFNVIRLPYVLDHSIPMLAQYDTLILVGAPEPVGFFAYPNKPSQLAPEGCNIVELASHAENTVGALELLIEALGAGDAEPEVTPLALPDDVGAMAGDPVDLDNLCRAIAMTIPENAIICDESITTGRHFYPAFATARPHTLLHVTGGAIGGGLPLAVGAAIACPDRKVIVLQSDGSGMYTNQALWTMAREDLDVAVFLFSNRSYKILVGEMKGVGAAEPGPVARDMFSLDRPEIEWTGLARSMGVEAQRVTTAGELLPAFERAIAEPGPRLVEIML